ncbi:MAG: hypothetical protein ACREP6_15380, partial [Candidatus Binataceae bacterium]
FARCDVCRKPQPSCMLWSLYIYAGPEDEAVVGQRLRLCKECSNSAKLADELKRMTADFTYPPKGWRGGGWKIRFGGINSPDLRTGGSATSLIRNA